MPVVFGGVVGWDASLPAELRLVPLWPILIDEGFGSEARRSRIISAHDLAKTVPEGWYPTHKTQDETYKVAKIRDFGLRGVKIGESPTIKNTSHFFDSHTAGTAHLWFVNLCLAFGGDLKKPTTVGHSSTSNWNPNWETNGSTIVSLNLSNITSRPNNCILFEANSFLCWYTASVGFSATNPFLLIVCICMLSRAFRLLRVISIFMLHLHIFKASMQPC